MTKEELIAQLDSARWQISRDSRAFGDDLSHKLSVKGQLQRSIKNRPSTWSIGAAGFGLLAARLIFRKKSPPTDKKPSFHRAGSPLSRFMTGTVLKTMLLAFEPLVASVLKDRTASPRKPSTTHV